MGAKELLFDAVVGALALYTAQLSSNGGDLISNLRLLNKTQNASFYADLSRGFDITYGFCDVEGIRITKEKWGLDAKVEVMLDETQPGCENPDPQAVRINDYWGILDGETLEPIGYRFQFEPTHIRIILNMTGMGIDVTGPAYLDNLRLTNREDFGKSLSVYSMNALIGTSYKVVEK